jgi:DNA-binding MarR family transcriptional regulator
VSDRKYDEQVIKFAHDVWEVMHREAKNRGFALQRNKTFGDGRVIINTVGAFIKGLGGERGWDLNQTQVDLIRRYLRASGNVVVLEKMEQYKFKIFIRETWHDGIVVTVPVEHKKTREDRLTPEEAGETRPPAPVTVRKAEAKTAGRDEDLISEPQAKVLLHLHHSGGTVTDDSGFVSKVIAAQTGLPRKTVTSTMGSLQKRGLVKRQGPQKRTKKLTLTTRGVEVVRSIDVYRAAPEVVFEFIQGVKVFEAPTGQLYEKLAQRLGKESAVIGRAVRALEERKAVLVDRNNGDGYPYRVRISGVEPGPVVQTPVEEEPVPEREDEPLLRSAPVVEAIVALEGVIAQEMERIQEQASKNSDQQEKLDLIASLVKEVNEGKLSPLKALGEIEAALEM